MVFRKYRKLWAPAQSSVQSFRHESSERTKILLINADSFRDLDMSPFLAAPGILARTLLS